MQAGLRCGIGQPDKARDEDTIENMAILAKSMIGRRMVYCDLIARNGCRRAKLRNWAVTCDAAG